jgi:hypothetical protein
MPRCRAGVVAGAARDVQFEPAPKKHGPATFERLNAWY